MEQASFHKDFLESTKIETLHEPKGLDLQSWFNERQAAHQFRLEQISFRDLVKWHFAEDTGNLVHDSGKFFSIEGVNVHTNWGLIPEWDQPIINQPEIGFLGFITRKIEGVLYFLVQAKMEPGNINLIQLSPTLQATRSNFTCVHQGRKPKYLEYFTDHSKSHVIVDSLQSEQGGRFLCKRNRNIIVEVEEEIPPHPDYCWMTLGQLLAGLRQNNFVNMDSRTVISCIPFDIDQETLARNPNAWLTTSFSRDAQSLRSNEEIISWFTEMKFQYELEVTRIPLCEVRCWEKTDMEIRHLSGEYFSVIACSVEADSREVSSWTQPLIKSNNVGLIAFIIKEFNGVPHFLVQGKVEPGNFDIVEMAPSVQCLTGRFTDVPEEFAPPFLNYVLNAKPEQIIVDTLQSEE
jgi:oxidase EvaA